MARKQSIQQIKKTLRNNIGRIAAVTAAFAGVFYGVRRWRATH